MINKLCEICGKREAIYYSQIYNVHCCGECLANLSKSEPANPFASLLKMLGLVTDNIYDKQNFKEKKCPSCGTTYSEFSEQGLLGCPDCYAAFLDDLRPLLRQYHGNPVHAGSVPELNGGGNVHKESGVKAKRDSSVTLTELDRLQKEMKDAIEREEFEKAAEIRDRIKKIKPEEEK